MTDINNKDNFIFERVVRVINKIFEIGRETKQNTSISMDTDIYDDLGIDSLETLDLLNGLEEEFNVSPNQHEAISKRKIYQIVEYIKELERENEFRR